MMSFLASFYSRGRSVKPGRRQATQHDVFMFEAIVGKASDLPANPSDTPPPEPSSVAPSGPAIQAVVQRAWKPKVAQISVRLRAICEQGVSQKRPQVAGWLRHLSDQAFKRIDQAQARIAAARPDSKRRRVEARELLSIRPSDPEPRPQSRDYKHVA